MCALNVTNGRISVKSWNTEIIYVKKVSNKGIVCMSLEKNTHRNYENPIMYVDY